MFARVPRPAPASVIMRGTGPERSQAMEGRPTPVRLSTGLWEESPKMPLLETKKNLEVYNLGIVAWAANFVALGGAFDRATFDPGKVVRRRGNRLLSK